MTKKKNKTQIVSQSTDTIKHEFSQSIDGETVQLVYKQNDEIKGIQQYIIRTRYEIEKSQLEQQIRTLQLQIQENSSLRQTLENEIQKLKFEKEILETRIKSLENDIEQLKKHNSEQKIELDMLRNDRLKRKLIIAIQDVNSIHQLEQKIDPSFGQCLADLRDSRNHESHYILWNRTNNPKIKSDPEHIKNYKEKLLIDMIEDKNMKLCIEEIDTEFGEGLMNEIKNNVINYIDTNMVEPTEDEKQKINNFWK